MAKMMSQFVVTDYTKWRPAFDGYAAKRAQFGVTNPQVYRGADNQNDVLIVTEVADAAKARQMMASQDLRETMQKAGVVGQPKVYILE